MNYIVGQNAGCRVLNKSSLKRIKSVPLLQQILEEELPVIHEEPEAEHNLDLDSCPTHNRLARKLRFRMQETKHRSYSVQTVGIDSEDVD
jgi:hypothetical protein